MANHFPVNLNSLAKHPYTNQEGPILTTDLGSLKSEISTTSINVGQAANQPLVINIMYTQYEII